jgi:hypothetical protein
MTLPSIYLLNKMQSQNANKWLERNDHGLTLNCGDVDYRELGNFLILLKFDRIYVKGLQKQHIL